MLRKGRTIRKFIGGGGGAVKKLFAQAGVAQGKFDNEKKFLRLENYPPPPAPPITFLMVRP